MGDEYACLTRTYAFAGSSGLNGNRTSQATYGANTTTGECQVTGTPMSSATYTIDAADRMSAAGMTLDAFGRTTALPAGYAASGSAVTLAYYTDDVVASITTGTQSRTYGLDPTGNVRTVTATGVPAGTPTSTRLHYDGGGDSPTWTVDTSSTGTTTTRFLDGLSGDPVATSTTGASSAIGLNLVNLRGDVVRTTSVTATSAPDGQFNDADEFGITRDPADPTGAATANGPRYGWLGAKQRAADTGAGLVLMGVRVYAPQLGRFLQADPIYGGSANAYDYANAEPVVTTDISGACPFCIPLAVFAVRAAQLAHKAHKARQAAAKARKIENQAKRVAEQARRKHEHFKKSKTDAQRDKRRDTCYKKYHVKCSKVSREVADRAGEIWKKQGKDFHYREPKWKNNQRKVTGNLDYLTSRGDRKYFTYHMATR